MSKHKFVLHQFTNYFDYLATLCPIEEDNANAKMRAKILCTIGPAARSVEMLEKLMENGMRLARILLGKGNYDYEKDTILNIRTAAKNYGEKLGRYFPFSIAVDITGPEVKVGLIECGFPFMVLKTHDEVKLTTNEAYKER